MQRHAVRLATFGTLCVLLLSACGGSSTPDGPLSEGRSVYGSTCSACHGSSGGGGVGPAFDGVVETFPTCVEHQKWVTLGSERWKAEVGPTYGATDKPIEVVMPEMGAQLTAREIAAVAAYERSTYGGQDPDEALTECGFAPDGTFTSP